MKKTISILAILGIAVCSIAYASIQNNFYGEEMLGASVLQVYQGGTGASTFTSGECLVGADGGAVTTTACGASAWTFATTTLDYWFDNTGGITGNSNIVTVGTIGTGAWEGTAIDFSTYTNATADTGIKFTGDAIGFDCSEVEGTGIDCATEAITLDATGDWTGTFDSLEGSEYMSLTAWFATTSHSLIDDLPALATVGTITAGTWQATDVGVAYGGTGVSTLTDGGILLGSGANAITAMGVLNNGGIVVGDGTTDPVALAAFTAYDGDLRHEAGGLEADVSSYSGLLSITGGATAEVNSIAEINALLPSESVASTTQFNASFSYATSTWTGTTTRKIKVVSAKETFISAICDVDGTLDVVFSDGTNKLNLINASSTKGTYVFSANNVFTAGDTIDVSMGNPASTPTEIVCSIKSE